MKKSIIKNLLAITFALGALVFVAGNVFGNDACPIETEIGEGGKISKKNQGIGYCTAWKVDLKCNSNGPTPCFKDC